MKTTSTHLKLTFICALGLSLCQCAIIASDTDSTKETADSEDLGSDFFEGKTNRIAKVYAATPTHVQVIYDGGKSGRKIPRQSLPPQLAAKYPYDADKAADYERLQMDISSRQIAAQQTIMEESARRREKELTENVTRLRTQAARLRGDVNIAQQLPGKRARAFRTAIALRELQSVRGQIAALEDQLTALRKTR